MKFSRNLKALGFTVAAAMTPLTAQHAQAAGTVTVAVALDPEAGTRSTPS